MIDGDTTNNNLNDGLTCGNNGCTKSNSSGSSQQFADYFVQYLQAYENLGAKVDAITIQNEPLNSQAGYPTMYVFAEESGDLIANYVGPALAKAGLDTGIWAYDHNTDTPSYPQTVLDTASAYVDTVAWHCYNGPDWNALTEFHNQNPGVTQYMTECWTPAPPAEPWYFASNFTVFPLQNWAAGIMAWTLGTNTDDGPHLSTGGCSNCQGLVTVADDGSGYTLELSYYLMAQFSKFMTPGATVLDGSGSYMYSDGTGLESVATLNNDGSRTVVMQNTFGNDISLTLTTKSGEVWTGEVPQNSVTTWILPAVG